MAKKLLQAEHGVICDMDGQRYGYFGWPSVTRMDDGTLVVGASGPRYGHICPWGKTSLFFSRTDGRTWTPPRILNDTPLDDRDCGVLALGGTKLLVTWFTSDIRGHCRLDEWGLAADEKAHWEAVFATYTEAVLNKWVGAWLRTSVDGEAWSDYIRTPVNTPHGPIRRANGELLYFGKQWRKPGEQVAGGIMAARSRDDGHTWTELGSAPAPAGVTNDCFHEPHVAETAAGKLVGLIRYQNRDQSSEYTHFSLFQTESTDGGQTWSEARYLNIYGSPPHLIRHSSGALVAVYCSRRAPLGQMAMFSHDEGRTWDYDWFVDERTPESDAGYPCSVEMPDGSIFTVYYQKARATADKCALLYSRWQLPPRG